MRRPSAFLCAVALVACGRRDPDASSEADAGGCLSAITPLVAASFTGLAAGGGALYVADEVLGYVAKIDPCTGRRTTTFTGLSRPTALAAFGDVVCWNEVGRVRCATATGPAVVLGDDGDALGLATDGRAVVWAGVRGSTVFVKERALGGGAVATLFEATAGPNPAFGQLVLDADSAYAPLALEDGVFLVRIDRRGAGATKLAPLPPDLDTALALDDRHLYFLSSDVMRVAKTGGAAEVVFHGEEPIHHLLADETHLFLADRLRVARVEKDGRNWKYVSHLTSRGGMVQDGAQLYLSEGSFTIYRVPKAD